MRKTSGISLMLLIFLSLSLITFSLLSISGATADENLSRRAADRTTEYYAAVTTANELLDRIDSQLAVYLREAQAESPASAQDAYLTLCASIAEDVPEAVWTDGAVAFTVPVTEEQVLQAVLTPVFPDSGMDKLYRIDAWNVVNTREWEADTSQNLFRSDSLLEMLNN